VSLEGRVIRTAQVEGPDVRIAVEPLIVAWTGRLAGVELELELEEGPEYALEVGTLMTLRLPAGPARALAGAILGALGENGALYGPRSDEKGPSGMGTAGDALAQS
jgi:hypothetical protein